MIEMHLPLPVSLAHPAPMFLVVLIVGVHSGCDEVLPPRNEPQQFLVTAATGTSGTVSYQGGVFDGTGGTLLMTVKNVYSEVLQGEEHIRGDVDVWMRDFPDRHASVQATKSNLTNSTLVRANLVTLGPDTTATLLKRWEHRVTSGSDSGRFFWAFVDSTLKFTQLGKPYYESDPVHFIAEARIQIFKNVQAVKVGQFEFTVVYRRF